MKIELDSYLALCGLSLWAFAEKEKPSQLEGSFKCSLEYEEPSFQAKTVLSLPLEYWDLFLAKEVDLIALPFSTKEEVNLFLKNSIAYYSADHEEESENLEEAKEQRFQVRFEIGDTDSEWFSEENFAGDKSEIYGEYAQLLEDAPAQTTIKMTTRNKKVILLTRKRMEVEPAAPPATEGEE